MEKISFDLPVDEAAELTLAAEGSLMSRSEYIRFVLSGRPVEQDLGLAALRRLIQLHGLASKHDSHGELSRELRELVSVLARAVRHRLV